MIEYHKIQTVYLRDPKTKFKTLLRGEYAEPEFCYLANNQWIFTEKVDGTNIRVMIAKDGNITFGGKTDNASIPAVLLERLAERFLQQHDLLVEIFPNGGCLYGEGYGARIQKGGGNYRPDQDFVLFDVKVGECWLQRGAVEDVSTKLGLDIVPIIGRGPLVEMVELAEKSFQSRWGDFQAEGIVARPACELKTRSGHRIITKIKTRDFATGSAVREIGQGAFCGYCPRCGAPGINRERRPNGNDRCETGHVYPSSTAQPFGMFHTASRRRI